ncbi:MAG: DUF3501 family protein [Candidatus Marinimicrobia bacterium]|jgi:hypothetical protein|nr:DUF3501 family protein [Candidatus Neomarinimicrobiota bacterium]
MKSLASDTLMNIIEYEKVRHTYRQDIIAYKKNRRISLGPNVMLTFENEKTLTFQIQEIMRAERLVHDEQIQEEVDVYNTIMPPENGLSATLFIEVVEEAKIRPVLNKFIGLTDHQTLYLDINGEKVYAEFEQGREEENKISSVHYVQFLFSNEQKNNFTDSESETKLGIDYKDYKYTETVPDGLQRSLCEDLS